MLPQSKHVSEYDAGRRYDLQVRLNLRVFKQGLLGMSQILQVVQATTHHSDSLPLFKTFSMAWQAAVLVQVRQYGGQPFTSFYSIWEKQQGREFLSFWSSIEESYNTLLEHNKLWKESLDALLEV